MQSLSNNIAKLYDYLIKTEKIAGLILYIGKSYFTISYNWFLFFIISYPFVSCDIVFKKFVFLYGCDTWDT